MDINHVAYMYLLVFLQSSTLNGQPTVPLCDRSSSINPPHTLTVTPGEPAILTCTTACRDVNNVYFVVPDTQNDILRASKFDRIHGSVNFTNNEENCSYSVDFYFTQDEQTIRDLHSVQCVFTGSTPCRTDIVSVIFADPSCNNRTQIVPSDVLRIPKGESSTLSCAAPCTDLSDILNVYLVRPGDGQNRDDLIISNDPTIEPLLSQVNFTSESTLQRCIYVMEISWTEDKSIRRELDTLQCIFTYGSTSESKVCRTAAIPVTFTDSVTGSVGLSVKPTSMLMNSFPGGVDLSGKPTLPALSVNLFPDNSKSHLPRTNLILTLLTFSLSAMCIMIE